MGLKFFQIDSESVAKSPPTNPLLDLPRAGAPQLIANQAVRFRGQEAAVIDEREEFLIRLYQATSQFKCGGHSFGVCLYIFSISATQLMEFEGQIRKALYVHDPVDTPHLLPKGQKIYHLSPRDRHTVQIWLVIRGKMEQDDRYAWLKQGALSQMGTMMASWYEDFWRHTLIEQSKIISDHVEDIQADVKGRMDQLVTFDLARSSIGERVLDRSVNQADEVTQYSIANVKRSLLPKPWKRPPLSRLHIRILIQYRSWQLAERYMYDDDGNILRNEEGEYRVVDRSPPMDSCSISYQLLEAVSVPGNDTAGLLEKLKHAVQTDLDVDLDMDELEIAWENPMNFWGHVKKLCRIRTSAELLVILEVLRVVHLVEQKNEPVVFLSLCPRKRVALERSHPPWPPAYPIEIETKVAKAAKRKADEPVRGSPARKKSAVS